MMRKIVDSRQLHFAGVGITVMVIGLGMLYLMVDILGWSLGFAKAVELGSSIQLNHFGNRYITYRHRNVDSWWKALIQSNIARAITAGLTWLMFLALTRIFGINYLVASAVSVAGSMVLNAMMSALWIFRDTSQPITYARWWPANWPFFTVRTWVIRTTVCCMVVVFIWLTGTTVAVYVAILAITAIMTLMAGSSLWLNLYAWHRPEYMEQVGFDAPKSPTTSFSLIAPVRNESYEVFAATIEAIAAQDHPDYEVVVVVSGDDDDETRLAVERLHAQYPSLIKVVYVTGSIKNKPLALQAALTECTKEIVGIVDAESIFARRLLVHVDTKFANSGADIVQAGVQLMNYNDSWFTLLNCLEYFRWFMSRLHLHAKQGVITLGGNSVFFKRSVLDALDGWDVYNLTEDAELSIRASAAGYKVVVAYSAELATQEETPATKRAIMVQRRRWMQGFLQTVSKGEWRKLQGSKRFIALYLLLTPRSQALSGFMLPISLLTMFWLKLPTIIVMATYLPTALTILAIATDLVLLHEFGEQFGKRTTGKHWLWLVIGTPMYQAMLSIAGVEAAWRHWRGINVWDKTAHNGLHLTAAVTTSRKEA